MNKGAENLGNEFSIFASMRGSAFLLQSDAPHFTIRAITNDLRSKFANGREIVGQAYAAAFPANIIEQAQLQKLVDENFTTSIIIGGNEYRPVINNGSLAYIILSPLQTTDQGPATRGLGELEDLFMQAPVAICMVSGPDYVVRLINRGMLQFLGRTPEVIGHPIEASLTEARQQGLIQILDHVRTSGQPYHVSTFPAVILIDGVREQRYFDLVFKPYSDAGDGSGIFCVAHNVTDQVLTLKKLEEEQSRTSLALSVGQLGVVSSNWITGEINSDQRAAEIFDLKGHHSLQEYINAFYQDDISIRDRAIEEGKKTGEFEFEARIVTAAGKIRWIRSRGLFNRDADGNPLGSFGVIQDITTHKEFADALHLQVEERTRELEEANRSLHELIDELGRSNRNLEEFAYAASHDMKEPIRKILLFADRLKDSFGEKLQENQSFYFNRMEGAALRMGVLIDDLLKYSHVSRGLDTLQEDVDLNKKLSLVMTDLELLIEEKKATIEADPLPIVRGHRRQFQQLLQNLVGNAIKYHKAGVPPVVRLTHKKVKGSTLSIGFHGKNEDHDYHLIVVEDNGIGFDAGAAEKIFDVFTRLHGNSEYEGTGVGLSIARKVAENHGGYLWAEGRPGEGSSFFIVLPV